MNFNLASPYHDTCSPPQTPYLAFSSPQSPDLLFSPETLPSRKAQIEIDCQAGLRCIGLKWTLHRNTVARSFLEGEAEAYPANRFRIRIAPHNLPAGFYDLRVTLDTGMVSDDPKRPVTGSCGFGWRADKMAIRDTRPTDFKAFWARAKAEMAKIPLDARQETPMETFTAAQIDAYNPAYASLPADYDPLGRRAETVESCKISFAGPEEGGRVYAWLAKPVGDGPFPAMLVLPGAGFNARPRPLEHARHGYVAIDLQVHGQDVDLAEYSDLSGYDGPKFEPVEAHYYYAVHQRVMQAVNYLAARPDVISSRIVTAGGSQGGRLGIVIAGLDSRIKAVVSAIANSANQPYLAWAAAMNGQDNSNESELREPPQFDGMDLTGAPPAPTGLDANCLAYFDPMNFAPDIKCPVLMNCGLIDPVSPPSSVWPVYLRLGGKIKSMVALPGLGHDWSAEFDRRAWRWLDEVLTGPAGSPK